MNDATDPGPILFASDLTSVSDNVARVAIELARRTGASLSTVHILTDSELEAAMNQLPEDQSFVDVVFEQVRQDLRAQIDRVSGTGVPAEVLLRSPCPVVAVPI